MSKPWGWIPIGPSTVIRGFAENQPRVSGRVRDIAVSPDGTRVYIAAAGGGVWYSGDRGSTWSPVGNWLPAPVANPIILPAPVANPIISPASPLSCGCLLVEFGPADGSADDVYVGTGEIIPDLNTGIPGHRLGGIGVLHLDKHLMDAIQNPFDNPWKREAPNLTGLGIFRLARDPRSKNSLVAATSQGLFFRTGPFQENAAWTEIHNDTDTRMRPSDVVWLPNGRLWVADNRTGADPGVLRFADPAINSIPKFTSQSTVDLPGAPTDTKTRHRLTIGTLGVPVNSTRFYVLGSGPMLWRVKDNAASVLVSSIPKVPPDLFDAGEGDQSAYDSALAVHPAGNDDIVFIGGGGRVVQAAPFLARGFENASLHRLRIPTGNGQIDSTYIGLGIHADGHQIFLGADGSVWVTCDGGVFRSPSGDALSFIALNSGLPVLETGYVANSPVSEGFVISGSQDNGILIRAGDTVWYPLLSGDGGSVMFHPVRNNHFFFQVKGTVWKDNDTHLPAPIERNPNLRPTTETKGALAYSTGDIREVEGDVRVAFGTNRVWYLKNWNTAGKNSWVTLPTGEDPLVDGHGNRRDTATDTYGRGTGQIVSCRWMDDRRLIVLMHKDTPNSNDSAVLLLQDKKAKSWDRIELSKGGFDPGQVSNLPPLGGWSEIGIHDPSRGRFGSFYVACTGFVDFNKLGDLVAHPFVDTLYWFDGDKRWIPTGLRTANSPPNNIGTSAPALAVVCDPDDPNIVYVGTTIGVWRGTLVFTGNDPAWPSWQPFHTDLPPVAVQDLAIYHSGSVKLLRAATQSRGVWEVDLATAPPPSLLFLRVHPNDSRRQLPSPLRNPSNKGPDPWVWFASPDVRIRPKSGQKAPDPPKSLPWTSGHYGPSSFDLWTFQTAFRHNKKDSRCRPTGEWTPQFDECVSPTPPQGSKQPASITPALWLSIVTQADAFAEPWDGEPSEADLLELIIENHDLNKDRAREPLAGPPQYSFVGNRKYKIDVLLHYRDLTPLPDNQIRVTLLFRSQTTKDVSIKEDNGKTIITVPNTISIPANFSSAVAQLITGGSFPPVDNWKVADTEQPVRSPGKPIDVTTPRVVTFEIDFSPSTFKVNDKFVLLAIAHRVPDQGTDPGPTLTGATLEELVLKNVQAAARIVVVKA
jgi:hypothetical protein